MEYFKHSLCIRILAVLLTVIIQLDLLDAMISLYPEVESQQLEQTINQSDNGNEDGGTYDQSICHLRSQQKVRMQILYHILQPIFTQTVITTCQKLATCYTTFFSPSEYHSLLTLFCIYRI